MELVERITRLEEKVSSLVEDVRQLQREIAQLRDEISRRNRYYVREQASHSVEIRWLRKIVFTFIMLNVSYIVTLTTLIYYLISGG